MKNFYSLIIGFNLIILIFYISRENHNIVYKTIKNVC